MRPWCLCYLLSRVLNSPVQIISFHERHLGKYVALLLPPTSPNLRTQFFETLLFTFFLRQSWSLEHERRLVGVDLWFVFADGAEESEVVVSATFAFELRVQFLADFQITADVLSRGGVSYRFGTIPRQVCLA